MHNVDHTKNIIEVNNVSFSYGGSPVLKDVTFSIHRGDYLGIIGPNGGGKSTLIKIIVGLLKPTSGTIKLFGKLISDFHDWPLIGYIPQQAVNFDSNFPVTVYEVVSMGLFAKKGLLNFMNSSDKQKILSALEKVEMAEYKSRLIGDLSGGQQQRVFIARALVTEPQVLILDEPTVGVDIKVQEKFYTLLQYLNRKLNITLVMVSHEVDVIAHEATEFACINRTLIYHGLPEEFIKEDFFTKLYGKGVKFVLHHQHD